MTYPDSFKLVHKQKLRTLKEILGPETTEDLVAELKELVSRDLKKINHYRILKELVCLLEATNKRLDRIEDKLQVIRND